MTAAPGGKQPGPLGTTRSCALPKALRPNLPELLFPEATKPPNPLLINDLPPIHRKDLTWRTLTFYPLPGRPAGETQTLIPMRKLSTLRVCAVASSLIFSGGLVCAQVTLGSSPYSQNFDGIGSGLPTGWTVRTGASVSALGTAQTFVTGTTNGWTSTTAQFRNAASSESPSASGDLTATQATRTDRVPSVRQSGTFGDPGAAFVLQIANTTGLTNFDLSFKLQSLDVSSTRSVHQRSQQGERLFRARP
jgi:hypothetical protein